MGKDEFLVAISVIPTLFLTTFKDKSSVSSKDVNKLETEIIALKNEISSTELDIPTIDKINKCFNLILSFFYMWKQDKYQELLTNDRLDSLNTTYVSVTSLVEKIKHILNNEVYYLYIIESKAHTNGEFIILKDNYSQIDCLKGYQIYGIKSKIVFFGSEHYKINVVCTKVACDLVERHFLDATSEDTSFDFNYDVDDDQLIERQLLSANTTQKMKL